MPPKSTIAFRYPIEGIKAFRHPENDMTIVHIDRALVDMCNRWHDRLPPLIWRVYCKQKRDKYIILADLWIPKGERENALFRKDVEFGYFKLTSRTLTVRYTIADDWARHWARQFFELFDEYLRLYGIMD